MRSPKDDLENTRVDQVAHPDALGEEASGILDEPTVVDSPTFEEAPAESDELRAMRDRRARALAEANLGLVEAVARKLGRQLGKLVEFDELLSVGRSALFEAAQVYNPSLSPFAPFATNRARWAMLDSVRKDTHGRVTSARARALGALEHLGFPIDLDDSVPPTEEAHLERFREALATQAAALFVGSTSASWTLDGNQGGSGTAEELLIGERRTKALKAALLDLAPREREVIERHYFGGERFDAIAESIGLSKSRVSRIHSSGLGSLGRKLRGH